VIVLGYGNQGRAQALNLRDSRAAARVRIWTRAGGPTAARARADGFAVIEAAALGEGEIFLCLLPDEAQPGFLQATLTPALRAAGRTGSIGFAHGFALQFTDAGPALRQPPWTETFLVAPAGPGEEVRTAFVSGGGVPALLAVWHDASGTARARALAVAQAIGALRAGVLETTVADEVVVDLFGEQAVLCGGLSALVRAGFGTLTRAGYPPELAYLECVHQLRLTADLIARHGIAGMRERISRTALYGDVTRGPRLLGTEVRQRMADILMEIESGEFSRQWMDEDRRGAPSLEAARGDRRTDPLEEAGRAFRARLQPPESTSTRPETGQRNRRGRGGGAAPVPDPGGKAD
jgi:ketol-acid reductoisomerase